MTAQLVTLILDRVDGAENPYVKGSATFTPSLEFPDVPDQQLVGMAPVTAVFRAGGFPQVKVIANDTAGPQGVSLPGWTWNVTYSADTPGSPAAASYYVLSANGATQRLSSLASVPAAQPGQQYAPLPQNAPVAGQALVVQQVSPLVTGWGPEPATGVTVLVAAPTGVTASDTANVTAAITSLTTALASGPAALLFQDGTYVIDSNSAVIRNVSNFAVRANGTTVIEQAPNTVAKPNNVAGDLMVIADCTDFRVEGITFDGNRDVVAPLTPLTASASSGQPSVTVAAGQGSRYQAGQYLCIFGGLGSSEQNQADGLTVGSGAAGLQVSSITPGGGAGGGDLITFTTNLGHAYTQVSSTVFSDGYGPYAYAGAYLTPYQAAPASSVAGRTLSGEDQQNGLHLINCQRVTVSRCTSRNTWESPFKLGTGFEAGHASLTDGCQQVTVSQCHGYHGYDQGISIWNSQQVTATGNILNATGWAGISCTASDLCAIAGNQVLNAVYQVPGGLAEGYGLVTEGGYGNRFAGNVVTGCEYGSVAVRVSPLPWGLTGTGYPTVSAYLPAQTAAGTSIQVSSTAQLIAGGKYSWLDGSRTEAFTVASIVDSTHVTLAGPVLFSHPAGTFIYNRVAQENSFTDNTLSGGTAGNAVTCNVGVRTLIRGNTVTGWGNGNGILLDYATAISSTGYTGGFGTVIEGNVIGGGNSACIRATGISGLVVKGNRLYGSTLPASSANRGILLQGVSDFTVEGNHISDVQTGNGILLTTGGPSSSGCTRGTVANNVVKLTGAEGIIALSATQLSITGNVTGSCLGNAGIDLKGVQYSVIANNTSVGNKNDGIRLEDNGATFCLYNRVTGNTCRDDGSGINVTTGAAQAQQRGINEIGSSNNNLFAFNEVDSNAAAQLAVIGAGSVQTRNIISGTIQAS